MNTALLEVSKSVSHSPISRSGAREQMATRYRKIRSFSEELCRPLQVEDYVIQSMPDASPAKWHLAHTSWFFETFVLKPGLPGYRGSGARNSYLFNSYYNAVGPMHCRARRGMISQPTVEQTYRYRREVDNAMLDFFDRASEATWREFEPILELGLHHEQQHQELFLTDIKHMLAQNPGYPEYVPAADRLSANYSKSAESPPVRWVHFPEGVFKVGHEGDGFAYDNESPRHRVFLEEFQLASRLVTNGEYLEFIEDGGYQRSELWLSLGWLTINDQRWTAPLYWEKEDDEWFTFTLFGRRKLDPTAPVCHLSYFEADAFGRWADARLPTEAEWEVASAGFPLNGNFVETKRFHPAASDSSQRETLTQMFGDVWEWTRSSYSPYPRYRAEKGAIGEYNGKFMCNQYVLRGGSCATSRHHIRRTYRNFFPPDKRWQFMGLRLAKDVV